MLNCVTTKAFDNPTLYEMWTGRKPKINAFKGIQVCRSHKINKKTSHKLEEWRVKMVHLGVENGSKAYRLFDPNTRAI